MIKVIIVLAAVCGYAYACSYLVVGKDASSTGAVLMSYNNDYTKQTLAGVKYFAAESDSANQLRAKSECRSQLGSLPSGWSQTIPFVANYIKIAGGGKVNGDTVEGGINDAGLSVLFGAYNYPKYAPSGNDPWERKGYGMEVWHLLLSRCDTPVCCVELLARLMAGCGAHADASGSWSFANSTDAWVFELISGHKGWWAGRIPDNKYMPQPNILRIGSDYNPSDAANWRGYSDLASWAQQLGLWDGQGAFNPAKAFGGSVQTDTDTRQRVWRVVSRFSPQSYGSFSSFPADLSDMPSFYAPQSGSTISPLQLRNLSRDHFEWTDQITVGNDYVDGSPHMNGPIGPLCRHITTYNCLYINKPSSVPVKRGGLMMEISPATPCLSAPVGFFIGVQSTPDPWNIALEPQNQMAAERARILEDMWMDTAGSQPLWYTKTPGLRSMRATYEASFDSALAQAYSDLAAASSDSAAAQIAQSFTNTYSASQYSLLGDMLQYVDSKK